MKVLGGVYPCRWELIFLGGGPDPPPNYGVLGFLIKNYSQNWQYYDFSPS